MIDKWEQVLKIDGIALKSVMGVLSPSARKDIEAAKVLDKESKSLSVKKK